MENLVNLSKFLINFSSQIFFFLLYSFKNNTSFVSRFNTLRRGRSSHNPSAHKLQAPNTSNDNLNAGSGASGNGSGVSEHPPLSREASLKKGGPGSDGEYYYKFFFTLAMNKKFFQSAVKLVYNFFLGLKILGHF